MYFRAPSLVPGTTFCGEKQTKLWELFVVPILVLDEVRYLVPGTAPA